MKKFLMLFAAAALLSPAAGYCQIASGEIVGSAALGQTGDLFECKKGLEPCNLHVRVYNEVDPTDFYGAANPVNGFPRYRVKGYYQADAQLTGNYPSAAGVSDLNWYSVWDGAVNPGRFDHVGYYGAQSQVVSFGELGNNTSSTCLPVVAQTACFLALHYDSGNDIDPYGPAGGWRRTGGLSPIPRPVVTYSGSDAIDFAWEEAAAATVNDGAPHPIQGYRLLLAMVDRTDRLGPSDDQLAALEAQGQLLEATPGTFLPLATTSFSLSSGDPVLADFDPASQRLVAVIKMVYAHDVDSLHYSANSYPATFEEPSAQVTGLRGRLERRRVVLDWQTESLAGVRAFSVLRASQAEGPYHPIQRQEIEVSGVQGTFVAFDNLSRRLPERSTGTAFYRLEVLGLDGNSTFTEPVAVNIESARGGDGR